MNEQGPKKDIPDEFHLSFVALLPSRNPELARTFIEQARRRRPGFCPDAKRSTQLTPRRVLFGYVRDEAWTWLLSHDIDPMPEVAWQTLFPWLPLPPHESCVHVYLTGWPEFSLPIDQARATLDLAAAWAASGATAITFPGGVRLIVGAELEHLSSVDVGQLVPADFYHLLVTFAGYPAPDNQVFIGTMGMSQFLQPDLGFAVAEEEVPTEQSHIARLLEATVPMMIELDRPWSLGEAIHDRGHRWVAGERVGIIQPLYRDPAPK